jgi:dihydrodipicolinate synthase/N-acetylneuraminate lyase
MAQVIAAVVTPLAEGGTALDETAFEPYANFVVEGGVDGVFPLGSTGEGILLSVDERRRVTDRWVALGAGRLRVIVHCGAQTTAETVELAAYAAEAGADGVGVIPPPYFPLDAPSLVGHLRAAGEACAPLPLYLYEFKARAGYPIPLEVVEELRATMPNLAGIKVSDTPWEAAEPYLIAGLEIYLGSEPLLPQGLERGATGTVSALAAGFPEAIVALANGEDGALERVREIRASLSGMNMPAAIKGAAAARGVPVRGDVRAPLRPLTALEREQVEALAYARAT